MAPSLLGRTPWILTISVRPSVRNRQTTMGAVVLPIKLRRNGRKCQLGQFLHSTQRAISRNPGLEPRNSETSRTGIKPRRASVLCLGFEGYGQNRRGVGSFTGFCIGLPTLIGICILRTAISKSFFAGSGNFIIAKINLETLEGIPTSFKSFNCFRLSAFVHRVKY